jgi:hypothetical protein
MGNRLYSAAPPGVLVPSLCVSLRFVAHRLGRGQHDRNEPRFGKNKKNDIPEKKRFVFLGMAFTLAARYQITNGLFAGIRKQRS